MANPIDVLILEDRQDDAELMIRELRRHDFAPEWYRVETGVDFIDALDTPPDVILADHTLPQFNALRALQHVAERDLHIPVIVVSGTIGEETAVEYMKQGATDYLLKDRLARLGPAVERAIEEARLRRDKDETFAQLRESEARFRRLAEKLPDIIYRYRLEPSFAIDYLNASITQVTGYAPDAFYADPMLCVRIVHPDDRLRLEPLLTGEVPDTPLTMRWFHKDGSLLWIEQRSVAVYDETGAVVAVEGVSRDITARVRAEEELRESEEIHRTTLNSISDAIFVTDKDGAFTYVCPNVAMIFGYTVEEVEGIGTIARLLGEDLFDKERLNAEGRIENIECETVDKAGELRHLLVTVKRVSIRNGSVLYACRDVTERFKVQRALRDSEERYRQIVETTNEGIWTIDAQEKITLVNDRMVEMLGYARDEIVGKSPLEFIDEDWRPVVRQKIGQRRTGVSDSFDVKLRRRDGSALWALVSATPLTDDEGEFAGGLAMITDITARKGAEEHLQFQADILRNVRDSVIVTDTEGTIRYWNEGAREIFGYTADEIIGNTPAKLYPDTAQEQLQADLEETLQRGEHSSIWQGRRKDGSQVWIDVKTTPMYDADRTLTGFVGVSKDVTERVKQAQELQQAKERFATAFQASPAAISITSIASGHFIDINESFVSLFGYARDELIGRSSVELDLWANERERDEVAEQLRREGTAPSLQLQARTKTGRTREVLASFAYIELDGEPCVLSLVHDISERVRREREQKAIVTLAEALRTASTRDEMLPPLLDQVCDVVGAGGAAIVFPDPINDEMVVELAYGCWADMTGLRFDLEVGISGHVMAMGQPYAHEDARRDPSSLQPSLMGGDHAVLCLPLLAQDTPIGALWVGRDTAFDDQEVDILWAIGDMAANALRRVTLYEQTRRRAEQLAAVNALGHRLGRTFELTHVYEQVSETVHRLVPDISTLLISRFDPVEELIRCVFLVYERKRLDVDELPVLPLEPEGSGIQSRVIRTREPLRIDDLPACEQQTRSVIRGPQFDPEPFPQSAVLVPMLSQGEVVGVLQLQSYTPNRFTPADVDLLESLANTAAVAVTNAHLFDDLTQRIEQLEALRTVDMTITSTFDRRITLNVLLEQVTTRLEIDAAAVLLLDPHAQMLEFAAGRGFRTSEIQTSSLRLGAGLVGRAALEQTRVVLPDLTDGDNGFVRTTLVTAEGFVSFIALPLVAKGKVKGVLELFHRSRLEPTSAWLEFLEALATQAAIAVEDADLFDELEQSNLELRHAYDATLAGWVKALDMRDMETEGHTRRVTEMAVRLARAMGVEEEELVHVRRGALLHDIGKMGVPDDILLKPGPLNDEEWAIMHMHPDYAYEFLSSVDFLRPALDIPYCHHEKWDGSGYPRGLAGEEIPLVARIFAVVDVYDALTSNRPYREAWPKEKARAHIRNEAGTHFDPTVVEAFFELLEHGD